MPTDPNSRRPPLLHLASQVFGTPLAIMPEKLDVILRALGPRLVVDQSALDSLLSSGVLKQGKTRVSWDDDEDDGFGPESSQNGSNQAKKPYKLTDSGVAIIDISGVLMKKGGWMSSLSGCSSYEGIGKACAQAMSDPSVRGLLFNIDSPGGTTHGCFELADQIHSYRGRKPMFAIANDLAASAAYALASSADRIFLTRTAGVGSIGVFCLHTDQSKLDASVGVKYTYLYAGDHKVDGNPHEPLSSSARESIQTEVDRSYEMFVSTVARNRGKQPAKIRGTQAEVMFADDAIPLLADSVGSYDDALSALTSKLNGSSVMIPLSSNGSSGGNRGESNMPAVKQSAQTEAVVTEQYAGPIFARIVKEDGTEEFVELATEAAAPAAPAPKPPKLVYTPARKVVVSVAAATKKKDDDSDPDAEPDSDEDDNQAGSADDDMQSASSCTNPDHPNGCNHGDATHMPTQLNAAAVIPATVANEAAVEIAELCAISGRQDLLVGFLSSGKTVKEARAVLAELRSKESADTSVTSTFGTISANSLDSLQLAAATLVANSNGNILPSAAFEQALHRNAPLYEAYTDEKDTAALTRGAAKRYLQIVAPRLQALGLGSVAG